VHALTAAAALVSNNFPTFPLVCGAMSVVSANHLAKYALKLNWSTSHFHPGSHACSYMTPRVLLA
jgi:hypothetical protein